MKDAPERIQVEFEAGSHEGSDTSNIIGYEYGNRDIRDFGYFHGEYVRKDKYDELLEAAGLLERYMKGVTDGSGLYHVDKILAQYRKATK